MTGFGSWLSSALGSVFGSKAGGAIYRGLSSPSTYSTLGNMGFFSWLTGGDRRARKSNEKMNRETNEANLQMNRETNEANMAMNQANIDYSREAWQNQVDYNWDMWNATNEYNSASSQVKRLQEAGLNPYMMMDGGSAGSAGSVSGQQAEVPSMIPMQPGHVDPYYAPVGTTADNLGALATVLSTAFSSEKNHQEAVGMGIENTYKQSMILQELAKVAAETNDKSAQARISEFNANMLGDLKDVFYSSERAKYGLLNQQIDTLVTEANLNDANARLANENAKAIPVRLGMEVLNSAADRALKTAQKGYYRSSSALTDAEAAIAEIEKHNKYKFTEQQKNELRKLAVDAARNSAELLGAQTGKLGLENEGLRSLPPWMRTGVGQEVTNTAGNLLGIGALAIPGAKFLRMRGYKKIGF